MTIYQVRRLRIKGEDLRGEGRYCFSLFSFMLYSGNGVCQSREGVGPSPIFSRGKRAQVLLVWA